MLKGIQSNLSEYYIKNIPKIVPIAPAPDRQYETMDFQSRKYNYKSYGFSGVQSVSIARRNARERNRVKQVNDGFNALRKRLPTTVIAALSSGSRRGSGKKLSKVDTLRMVVEYIKYLQRLIEKSDASLGITHIVEKSSDGYEGIYGGNSPYSESVPSPVSSECSSGVSTSYYPNTYVPNHQSCDAQRSSMEEDLLEAISWWQDK